MITALERASVAAASLNAFCKASFNVFRALSRMRTGSLAAWFGFRFEVQFRSGGPRHTCLLEDLRFVCARSRLGL